MLPFSVRVPRARISVRLVMLVVAALLAAAAWAEDASASHFRHGNISWQKSGPAANGVQPVVFQYEQSWRRSAFPGTGADGFAEVGDVVSNGEGCINFGDGTSPTCPSYRVTFVNKDEDYLRMYAVNPADTTARTDPNIPHDYAVPAAEPYIATTGSCCTISNLANAADASWSISSLVDLTNDDESARSTIPAIVQLPAGGTQRFTVPANDAGGETLRFRLATELESCGGCTDHQPPGLAINPTTGEVTWDTTGRDQGPGGQTPTPTASQAEPDQSALWWSSVVIESLSGGDVVSSVQIDYIIRVGGAAGSQNQSPVWDQPPTPGDASLFTLTAAERLDLTLQASDPDEGDTVSIFHNSGPGAFTPSNGNPATGAYTYTSSASDIGNDQIIQFIAQDDGNPPLGPPFRSYTIRVVEEPTPPTARIDSGPFGNPAAPTFTFSADQPGQTFECRIDLGAFQPCTSPFTTPPLSEGPHTFEVRATDSLGAVGPVASRNFTAGPGATPALEGLSVEPTAALRLTGQSHVVVATALLGDGNLAPGRVIRYTIAGANPSSGAVTTGSDGRIGISWVGTNAGVDTLSAYSDVNGDGGQQVGEPQAIATAEWIPQQGPLDLSDLPAPIAGRTVNVEPARGLVFVKLPPGATLSGARASQGVEAPRGFIPLTQAAQIPMGSILDTTRGKVRMVTAATISGSRTQTGIFFSGRFQVKQRRTSRPITEMVLKGGSFRDRCRSGRGARGDASRHRGGRRHGRAVRRLWGRGSGRYRTRGRYSSATVRGTTWLVEDGCSGTFTRVPRRPRNSRVDVRDHVRRTTVTLRAGQRYFAKRR